MADRAQVLVRREQKLQAITPWRMSLRRLEENKAPSQNFIIAMPQRQKRFRLTA